MCSGRTKRLSAAGTKVSASTSEVFAGGLRDPRAVLLAEVDGRIAGFAELSIRPYAEDCDTDRVAYLAATKIADQDKKIEEADLFVKEIWVDGGRVLLELWGASKGYRYGIRNVPDLSVNRYDNLSIHLMDGAEALIDDIERIVERETRQIAERPLLPMMGPS